MERLPHRLEQALAEMILMGLKSGMSEAEAEAAAIAEAKTASGNADAPGLIGIRAGLRQLVAAR